MGIISVATNGAAADTIDISAAGILLYDVVLWVNLLSNVILTGLIAGRLWWIFLTTKQSLKCESSDIKGTNNVGAMVLESGLLYPLALIVSIVVTFYDVGLGRLGIASILTVIVGIAATMIMVRADLKLRFKTTSEVDHKDSADVEMQQL
ncbi:hypothetical protein GYMLUDRAFT_239011 [Collybiopsis luxurians FD-317 M1]|nr:hypothetical protein GYMLUDRAFT_239011 [Collybiopsis luxurians FD-317 M1]